MSDIRLTCPADGDSVIRHAGKYWHLEESDALVDIPDVTSLFLVLGSECKCPEPPK